MSIATKTRQYHGSGKRLPGTFSRSLFVQDKLSFNIHLCLSLKCEGLFTSLDSFFFSP